MIILFIDSLIILDIPLTRLCFASSLKICAKVKSLFSSYKHTKKSSNFSSVSNTSIINPTIFSLILSSCSFCNKLLISILLDKLSINFGNSSCKFCSINVMHCSVLVLIPGIFFNFTPLNTSFNELVIKSIHAESITSEKSLLSIEPISVSEFMISFSTNSLISSINFTLFFFTAPPIFKGVYSLKIILTAYLLVMYPATAPENPCINIKRISCIFAILITHSL